MSRLRHCGGSLCLAIWMVGACQVVAAPVGAAEYFVNPAEQVAALQAMRQLAGLDAGRQREGRLIVVHGLRSGVGAGLLTAGLAAIAAQTLQRSTCAVDLGFTSPTVGSWLGCDQPGALHALLADPGRLDHSLLEQGGQAVGPLLHVLDGEWREEQENAPISSTHLGRLSQLLAQQYQCQFWRMPPGAAGRSAMVAADVCVLVGDGSLPAMRAGLALLPWLRDCCRDTRLVTVFNQTRPHMPCDSAHFAQALGQPEVSVLPYQRSLAGQSMENLPFHDRRHTLHAPLLALAEELLQVRAARTPWWRRWR